MGSLVGFGIPVLGPVTNRIEESYTRRILELDPHARLLLLAAAADPLGDPILLQRASGYLGLDLVALDPALDAGLLHIGARVQFAHPLARAAAYRSAAPDDCRRVHGALAQATDHAMDQDRRAWHLACACLGPSEDVAVGLERAAEGARLRGGMVAAAAFWRRASELTPDPVRRSERTLVAVEATIHAGGFEAASRLIASLSSQPLTELQRARVDLLQGQNAFMSTMGSDATPLLLKAAQSLEGLDDELARDTYLEAWGAALLAFRFRSDVSLRDVSEAARRRPRSENHATSTADLLLDGLSRWVTDGLAAARPTLEQAAATFADESFSAQGLRWAWMTAIPTYILWDEDKTYLINAQQLQAARTGGDMASLLMELSTLSFLAIRCGEFATATAANAEARALSEATGATFVKTDHLLAVMQGREAEAQRLLGEISRAGAALRLGFIGRIAFWMLGVLYNSTGRHAEYVAAAQDPANLQSDRGVGYLTAWVAMEVLEAAVRSDNKDVAQRALADIEANTSAAGSASALGVLARSRALLEEGETAEQLYEEGVARLSRSRLRPELARTHLLFGEWLRRQGRRVDARAHLRQAHDLFTTMGMEAFAERARRELTATGESVRRRSTETLLDLTAQEEQICRLALDGLSNREIGIHLFISGRTVEWHLSRVFAKLGITSRRQLHSALANRSQSRLTK